MEGLRDRDQYVGRNYWIRLTASSEKVSHAHWCPHCNEAKSCEDSCTLIRDLELFDGTPCGAPVICSTECQAENDAVLEEILGTGFLSAPDTKAVYEGRVGPTHKITVKTQDAVTTQTTFYVYDY